MLQHVFFVHVNSVITHRFVSDLYYTVFCKLVYYKLAYLKCTVNLTRFMISDQ